jgi:hypothetical protein
MFDLRPKASAWVLERTNHDWDEGALQQLANASVEAEFNFGKFPRRIVALNKPLNGKTLENAISSAIYTVREVPYEDRWK